jgi:hypothetical protein
MTNEWMMKTESARSIRSMMRRFSITTEWMMRMKSTVTTRSMMMKKMMKQLP